MMTPTKSIQSVARQKHQTWLVMNTAISGVLQRFGNLFQAQCIPVFSYIYVVGGLLTKTVQKYINDFFWDAPGCHWGGVPGTQCADIQAASALTIEK
eukprot:8351750-Karenia_brevis.AAC.1